MKSLSSLNGADLPAVDLAASETKLDRDRLWLAQLSGDPSEEFVWVWLSSTSRDWRSALTLVQPATVIGWHRQGLRLGQKTRRMLEALASLLPRLLPDPVPPF